VEVLVVDKEPTAALAFINSLALPYRLHITFIPSLKEALQAVRFRPFAFFLLGDKISGGDTYKVGLEIKSSRNRHRPVVCLGTHKGRRARLFNLLKPYSLCTGQDNLVYQCLRDFLATKRSEV
jgi:DNA-binding NtrC family response regulator